MAENVSTTRKVTATQNMKPRGLRRRTPSSALGEPLGLLPEGSPPEIGSASNDVVSATVASKSAAPGSEPGVDGKVEEVDHDQDQDVQGGDDQGAHPGRR